MLKERRPDLAHASTIEISRPAGSDWWEVRSRARWFAELEALIRANERARLRLLWDVPESDRRLRLQGLERSARRQGQLAESARLAGVRRVALRRSGSTH